ncbi:hypothetical protein BDZ89DRAFT_1078046 [Hymenopellis radicata]|nr:hypothetical protein BDZ89DRAFT_1078046 [Hymenopellis radicata]
MASDRSVMLNVLVIPEKPTQQNAERLDISTVTLKVSAPDEDFGVNVRYALGQALQPGSIPPSFCLYRACEKGYTTQQALKLKLAAMPFDNVAVEIPPDATYEEFFLVPSDRSPPRGVAFIAVVGPRVVPVQAEVPPTIDQNDKTPPEVRLLQTIFKNHQTAVLNGASPSVAAKSSNYIAIQTSDAALLDGRVPPNDFVRDVAALLRKLSAVNTDENTRDKESRLLLAKVLDTNLEKLFNSNKTSADYSSPIKTPIDTISGTPVIIEMKSELGNGGSDPSLQVSFSYEQYFCAPERDGLLKQSNCPSFLLGVAGPWIVICGAVLPHKTVVQRLSGYEWHACSRIGDDAQVLTIARKFFALRRAIAELADRTDTPSNRYYPSFNSYMDENNNSVAFRYVKPLEMDLSCIVFLAERLDNEEQFVVKFVSRYNAAAHTYMAEGGYAPRLLCHQPLGPGYGDWALVAMDYVAGQTIFHKYGAGPLPDDVLGAIRNALDYLHSEQYILPDLRRPNVMILDQEDLLMGQRIKIIDFDWVSVEGDGARYPFHLSTPLEKLAKAKEYDVITKAHEENMFKNL